MELPALVSGSDGLGMAKSTWPPHSACPSQSSFAEVAVKGTFPRVVDVFYPVMMHFVGE